MTDEILFGGEEVNPESLNYNFSSEGVWQGPWISLPPEDNYRRAYDPDEKEYYALENSEVLKRYAEIENKLSEIYPIHKRLRSQIYDPASPILDEYNDYRRDVFAKAVRELVRDSSLQRLDWKFKIYDEQ